MGFLATGDRVANAGTQKWGGGDDPCKMGRHPWILWVLTVSNPPKGAPYESVRILPVRPRLAPGMPEAAPNPEAKA